MPSSSSSFLHRSASSRRGCGRRGDTSDTDIARRLAVAEAQIAEADDVYDHLVVNDDLPTAIDRISSILLPSRPNDRGSSAAGSAEVSQQER